LNHQAVTPVVTTFAQQEHSWSSGLDLLMSAAASYGAGALHVGPRTQLRWRLTEPLSISASYARTHQFAQSVRNTESIVGSVFPVDLYVGAGALGIPVAKSDQVVLAADYRPLAGLRLGAQAYDRVFRGVVTALREPEPFGHSRVDVGSGTARGLGFDATVTGARYGVIANYSWQRVRVQQDALSYTPEHGSSHLIDAGLILFPSATSSVRVGLNTALGRRSTTISGPFEWEACNLLDRGCEFSGSPRQTGPTGGTGLPPYLRLDLGFRKHVHFELRERDAVLGLFGTFTNVFGRSNVLTYATEADGGRTAIEMRPRAPLVLGLDWRF
jgi:hypothetical protein